MSNRSSLELSTRTVKIYSGAADAQARAEIAEHAADVANPHDVTAEQVGLGNADNTSDANKPVSGPHAAALALKAPLASPALSGVPTAPTALLGTATDQVATTAFAQAAVNLVGNDVGEVGADLESHQADTGNPHGVTKAQVGLALVDNTADATKPVSAAQQTAINVATAAAEAAQSDIDGHQFNLSNPHGVTKAQVGLGSVDNTADLAKPVSAAQQTAINAAGAIGTAAQADIDGHQLATNNPHAVTKTQIGLGNADNTSDLNKPISTAQAAALALKAPLLSPALTGVPIAPTAAPGANTTQLATTAFAKAAVDSSAATLTAALALKAPLTSPTLTGVPTAPTAAVGTSNAQLATTAFADAIGDALTASLGAHTANVSNPHLTTKSQIGLGNADNTSDLAKPVSTAQQTAINVAAAAAAAAQADIDAHEANTSNPHAVDKSDVGLDNVDNTSDAGKPISSATQIALNLKAPLASPAITGAPTAPTAVPLTNTTQLATTAYADAAVAVVREIADGAQADADAAQAAADAAQADATQALADAAEALAAAEAPAAAISLYGETKTGEAAAAAPIDPAWAAISPAGTVIRVVAAVADDPQTIAPITAIPLVPGRVYDVIYRVQRIVDPLDPLNDSVTCGIQWLTNTKAANGSATVDDIALVITDGVVQRTARIGIAPPVTVSLEYTAPPGTVYFRPFIDLYGGDAHTTDIITLDVQDVTAAAGCCGVPVNVLTPASGDTVTLADARPAYVNTGSLAMLTIKLPPGATGRLMEVGFASTVTTLAMQDASGAAIPTAHTSAFGPGAAYQFRWLDAPAGWVYWK